MTYIIKIYLVKYFSTIQERHSSHRSIMISKRNKAISICALWNIKNIMILSNPFTHFMCVFCWNNKFIWATALKDQLTLLPFSSFPCIFCWFCKPDTFKLIVFVTLRSVHHASTCPTFSPTKSISLITYHYPWCKPAY